jgi:hypothetical protein
MKDMIPLPWNGVVCTATALALANAAVGKKAARARAAMETTASGRATRRRDEMRVLLAGGGGVEVEGFTVVYDWFRM